MLGITNNSELPLKPFTGASCALHGGPATSSCPPRGPFIPPGAKLIPLTQGKFAIVDAEDYEELAKHKWYAQAAPESHSFYAARAVRAANGKQIVVYMARQILGLERGDGREADHISHVTLDNRRANLRAVTTQGNQWNQKPRKGYFWDKHARKFKTQIMVSNVSIFLGYYDTPAQAHRAYVEAKVKYHHIETALLDPIEATYDD